MLILMVLCFDRNLGEDPPFAFVNTHKFALARRRAVASSRITVYSLLWLTTVRVHCSYCVRRDLAKDARCTLSGVHTKSGLSHNTSFGTHSTTVARCYPLVNRSRAPAPPRTTDHAIFKRYTIFFSTPKRIRPYYYYYHNNLGIIVRILFSV